MGVRAHLTRIPEAIYVAVQASGGFEPSGDVLQAEYDWAEFASLNLDKTWWLLNKVFKEAGTPLKHALEGDYFPEGGLDAFDARDDGESYLAYASAETSRQIAAALIGFPIEKALQDLADDARYIQYCLPYFRDLVEFYRNASINNEAVFITVF